MAKIEVAIRGVCCACQGTHAVYTNPDPPEEDLDFACVPGVGNSKEYYFLIARHRAFGDHGEWCEGEGTVPQAIIED